MQVCPVPFASGTGFALKSDGDKATLLNSLRISYGIRVIDPTGMSHAVKYNKAIHSKEIRKRGGSCSFRPKGIPHLLAMTRISEGGGGVCTFIDRRVKDGHFYPRVTLTRFEFFDPRVFDGTVIEGDLVASKNKRFVFVASDILADRGYTMQGVSAQDRRARLAHLLSPLQHRSNLATDICFLRPRAEFAVPALGAALTMTAGLDYDISAVIFRDPLARLGCPGEEDVVFRAYASASAFGKKQHQKGLDSSCCTSETSDTSDGDENDGEEVEDEKVEDKGTVEREKETAVFYVRRTNLPDVFELYKTEEEAVHGGVHAGQAPIAGVPSLKASELLRDASSSRPPKAIEFVMDSRFGKWTPS